MNPLFVDIPDLTEEQFKKFSELVYKNALIHLKEHKITLLSNRLRKRLRALGLSNFDDYYTLLTNNQTAAAELIHFLEVVTTNESYFWRTTQNYEMLREELLPELIREFNRETLMVWSAGCSTGEEPYNLTIELVESFKKYGIFPFKVFASDISQRVIDFAKAGRYNGRKIEKIPPAILNRYFKRDSDKVDYFLVREDIKSRIQFDVENLFTAKKEPMHCIFCRNVMIYFSRQDQQKLANRFYDMLKPGGYLIIGHSESLHMMDTPLQSKHFKNGVAYHRPRI